MNSKCIHLNWDRNSSLFGIFQISGLGFDDSPAFLSRCTRINDRAESRKDMTKDADFHLTTDASAKVPMMHKNADERQREQHRSHSGRPT